MLWFSVWAVLVLATLVGAVLLGLRLWRSAKALMAEASRSSAVLAELSAKAAALEEARGPDRVFRADLGATAEQRDAWRTVRDVNRAARDARRLDRRRRTLERWRAIGIPF